MSEYIDGPSSPAFCSLKIKNSCSIVDIIRNDDDKDLKAGLMTIPEGDCVFRGLPFFIDGIIRVGSDAVLIEFEPVTAQWLVFLHTADKPELPCDKNGFISPMRGEGDLNQPAAAYNVIYSDGSAKSIPIRRRHEISAFSRRWGENSLQAVPHMKPTAVRQHHEQTAQTWGRSQTRVNFDHYTPWLNQLYAWENPNPEKQIVGIECRSVHGEVFICGLAAGDTNTNPLGWEQRRKALINLDGILPKGEQFDPTLDEFGQLSQIKIDLGTIISAMHQRLYPINEWESGHNNLQPEISDSNIIVEYTAHTEANFYLAGNKIVPLDKITSESQAADSFPATPIATSYHRLQVRVVERGSTVPVPVKIHIHGEAGEYLAPVDRHRIPNNAWFEDYSTDFVHMPVEDTTGTNGLRLGPHYCTYIPGETFVDVPPGRLFVEVSKGYEIIPVRKIFDITSQTDIITIELDRVLHWRDRGWISADTHVHFLSPVTALIEGSAEGVNVVNLLASQWGELMTNVGDFDGKTTWGSREAGGEGEYLVRVGTENRQHILGHISLLGYEGRIIAPMTTGGPMESALGDPVEVLLTEWARQCKKQNGVVILPHFPNPRLEGAAAIVDGSVDGVEMTSWGNLYGGIDPYSLSDWYRYLNCGYPVAAVGGTDKMSAATAVGTSRTYVQVASDSAFTYQSWADAVRKRRTFVTYGPLLEFSVDGVPLGGSLDLPSGGGTVDVTWDVASVTIPVSEVDLMINGEVAERFKISDWDKESGSSGIVSGSWHVKLDSSSWLALLVRGHYTGKQEIIVSHSSAVMAKVAGSEFYVEHDAISILEQIEGSLAYIDTVGTRAQTKQYKRIRMVLQSVHRKLHNRMHKLGHYHEHTVSEDHREHH